jgi:hypothetical protein
VAGVDKRYGMQLEVMEGTATGLKNGQAPKITNNVDLIH